MGLEILLGVGVKGAEKEGMRFKPWVTVQALRTLICHSEPGLSQGSGGQSYQGGAGRSSGALGHFCSQQLQNLCSG